MSGVIEKRWRGNPVFKEMEMERERKERTKARQAEEPAQTEEIPNPTTD